MKVGSLADWVEAQPFLLTPVNPGQRFSFDLAASRQCAVFANGVPVAVGQGLIRVDFASSESVNVTFECEEGGVIYLRDVGKATYLPPSDLPSFTRIEPRRDEASANVARTMHIMQLNMLQREKTLREEFAARLAAIENTRVVE